MGMAKKPHKVKLIAGILYNDMPAMLKAVSALKKMFGPTDLESEPVDFNHTDYYADEMGAGLKRIFVSFRRPVSLKNIQRVKTRTNRIERVMSRNGKRSVNIDPGYLDLSKLVLFSTKDYSHMIHLGDGIFAEVTLFYKDSAFNAWPWTYPDYRTPVYAGIFDSVRRLYREGR